MNRYTKYSTLAVIFIIAVLIFINFTIIRSMDSKIESFMNSEFQTRLMKFKVRCSESIPQRNLLFTNYDKTFKDCKLYKTTFNPVASIKQDFDHSKYFSIPQLDISYQPLKKFYTLTFDKIIKQNKNNIIENYTLVFDDQMIVRVKHESSKLTNIDLKNDGGVFLLHNSGIQIAEIEDHSTEIRFRDNDEMLGFDAKIAFSFDAIKDFMNFVNQNGKKHVLEPGHPNDVFFDAGMRFERYSKKEQEELKKNNPKKYEKEKNFFKNFIYDINSIKITHKDFVLEVFGDVISSPGKIPDADVTLRLTGMTKATNYIKEGLKASFYNNSEMQLYNEIRPDLIVRAFVKTAEDLSLIKDDNLEMTFKNNEIGHFSISGTNLFIFQSKFATNMLLLKSQSGTNSDSESQDSNTSDNN